MKMTTRLGIALTLIVLSVVTLPAQTIDSLADQIKALADQIKVLNAPPPPPPPPPAATLACPANQTVTAPNGTTTAVVTYAPTVSGGVSPVTVTCAPSSGTSFPVGATNVQCSALDGAGQSSPPCGFSVTVNPPIVVPPPPPPPPPPQAGAPPGATTLLWKTDFNRGGEWDYTKYVNGLPLNLPGVPAGQGFAMFTYGGWHTSGHPNGEEVTAAANAPGSAGQGQRHWVCPGVNCNSGSLSVQFPATGELWIRMKVRYQAGPWFVNGAPLYHKLLYGHGSSSTIPEFVGANCFNIWTAAGSNHNRSCTGGWSLSQGGPNGSGQWFTLTVHLKTDTNRADGVGEAWINVGNGDVRVLNERAINYGGVRFADFATLENMDTVVGTGDKYVDLDDLEIWK
jgi:hypothetical protein